MKKRLSLLLCIPLILSLFSCRLNDKFPEKPEETTEGVEEESSTLGASDTLDPSRPPAEPMLDLSDYEGILDLYRSILSVHQHGAYGNKQLVTALENRLVGDGDKEILSKLLPAAYNALPTELYTPFLSPHYKLCCGYAEKDLNGDGTTELVLLNSDYTVFAIFSKDNGRPVLLKSNYPHDKIWIDGNGSIHTGTYENSNHTVHSIARGGAELKLEIGLYMTDNESGKGYPNVYCKIVNDTRIYVTREEYYSLLDQHAGYMGQSGTAVTRDHAGLTFVPLFTENEIVTETYEAVLDDLITVYDTDYKKITFLKTLPSTYNGVPLRECDQLSYAYIDLDGDGSSELAINCGYITLLRYYEGVVYAYRLNETKVYSLNRDGSYEWHDTKYEEHHHGVSKISFTGSEMQTTLLWKEVSIGAPTRYRYKYYVGEESVTVETLMKYREEHPATPVTFTSFSPSWQYAYSRYDALEIATEYYGVRSGEIDSATGLEYHLFLLFENNGDYCVVLRLRKPNGLVHSVINSIEIDPFTGDVYDHPYDITDGK